MTSGFRIGQIEVIDSICFEIPDNLEVGLRDPLKLVGGARRHQRARNPVRRIVQNLRIRHVDSASF
jgi:maleate cis-trans isomerase